MKERFAVGINTGFRSIPGEYSPNYDWEQNPKQLNLHERGKVGKLIFENCDGELTPPIKFSDITDVEFAARNHYLEYPLDDDAEISTRIVLTNSQIDGDCENKCKLLICLLCNDTISAGWCDTGGENIHATLGIPGALDSDKIVRFIRDTVLELCIASSPSIRPIAEKWLAQNGKTTQDLYSKKVHFYSKEVGETSNYYGPYRDSKYISFAAALRQNLRDSELLDRAISLWDRFALHLAQEAAFDTDDIVAQLLDWQCVGGQLSESRIKSLVEERSKVGVNYLVRYRSVTNAEEDFNRQLRIIQIDDLQNAPYKNFIARQHKQRRKVDFLKFYRL